MADETLLELKDVTANYKSTTGMESCALSSVSIKLKRHEIIAVVGGSGSGKSTLLGILSGIKTISAGQIETFGERPRVAMMFQNNPLFPWMNVEDNLTYSLKLQAINYASRKKAAQEMCELVGINPNAYLSKFPRELSGGEQRRVALGMCLLHNADLLLLDEPSTGLDDANKWRFQELLQKIWIDRPFSVVVVTHDIEEAIMLGARVIGLKDGRVSGIIDVPLSYPRTQETRFSKEVSVLRQQASSLSFDSPDKKQKINECR